MNPTRTSHALRSIFSNLGKKVNVDAIGIPEKLSFPSPDLTTADFAKSYFAYNIGRKREPDPELYDNTVAIKASLDKWCETEFNCSRINAFGGASTITDIETAARFDRLYKAMRVEISNVLCDHWPDFGSIKVTSGATSTSRRRFCNEAAKLSGMPDPRSNLSHNLACTTRAWPYFREYLELNPALVHRLYKRRWKLVGDYQCDVNIDDLKSWLIDDSPAIIDFVTKEVESVRLIGKTGGGTMIAQKAIGSALRIALAQTGVDLSDQSVNQEWAEIGSHTGYVATVDLASASDNVALEHLRFFPRRWQKYFLDTRDTHIGVQGTSRKLSKIAMMGNGFIFELQTLLYLAACRAVCREVGANASHCTVYGDDIIIPTKCFALLEELFSHMGFVFNRTKSFSGCSPFRESCGKHFHHGVDVTPVYLKTDLDNLTDIFHLHNGISEWSNRTNIDMSASLSHLCNLVPKKQRFVVPKNFGKSGFHTTVESCVAPKRYYDKHLHTFRDKISCLVEVHKCERDRYPDDVHLTGSLLALEAGEPVLEVVPWKVRRLWRTSVDREHLLEFNQFTVPFGFETVGRTRVTLLAE